MRQLQRQLLTARFMHRLEDRSHWKVKLQSFACNLICSQFIWQKSAKRFSIVITELLEMAAPDAEK